MSKIKAPLFSLDATGTLDKNITYKGLKQKHIAQKYSQPGSINPFESSPRQKDQRSIIRLITIHWQCMSSGDKLAWETAAKDARFKGTGYHYFLSKAQQNLTQYLGLVGYWSMNYNVDDKIPDLSGNGNHGTLSPIYPCDCPTLVNSFNKKHGKALFFNGITNYIELGSNKIILPDDTSWTILFLTRFPALPVTPQYYGFFGNTQTVGEHNRFQYGYNDNLYLTDPTGVSATWTKPLSASTYYYFTLCCDGTDIDNIELFLNNISLGIRTLADSSQIIRRIGSRGPINSNLLYGTIDDFIVYNCKLNPLEILKIFQSYNLP